METYCLSRSLPTVDNLIWLAILVSNISAGAGNSYAWSANDFRRCLSGCCATSY
nr:MAG TPA: hypothetical protein [Caudoviricetes sp.]